MPGQAAHMRLSFLDLFGREPRNSKPMIETAFKQAVQERKFRRFAGDNYFSADCMFDAVVAAKFNH